MKAFFNALVIMVAMAACSPNFHCKKCNQLGGIKPDTVFATIGVPVRGRQADTLFLAQPGDTVYVTKDRIKIRYINLPGDTVYVDCNCLPDTVRVNVPVLVTNEIRTGVSEGRVYWIVGIAVVLALLAGLIFGRLTKKG